MSWLFITLAYLGLAAALHALLRRLVPGMNTVAIFLVAGAACGLAVIATLMQLRGAPPLCAFAGATLYAFLAELYIFSFTFAFGSVSASVLVGHLEGEGGGDVALEVPKDLMIRRRLEGMCASGLIFEKAGAYQATGKGKFAAAVGRMLKGYFGHRHSGHRAAQ
jgi:hypothetical protein